MEISLFGKEHHIPLNGLNVSRRLEYSILMKYLKLKGEELLLDVACGDGYWTAKMIPCAEGIVGFDMNFKRLRQARDLAPGIRGFIRSDAHVLPFSDGTFDKTVGICVLEHFDDDVGALTELHRVLKTGGILVLTVDSFSYPGMSNEEKARHLKKFAVVHQYTIESLREKLKKAGFEVAQWSYLLKTPVSALLYRWALKFPKLAYLFFPVSYIVSFWCERLSKNRSSGYKLAVAAEAV